MPSVFVATVPIVGGTPQLHPSITADEFKRKDGADGYAAFKVRKGGHSLVGVYLGRLDEGQFGTAGRPAVIVCTGSKGALAYLQSLASGDPDYNFMPLEQAWQITAVRQWLIANGMPTVAAPFGPDPSIPVRPRMPRVYCGQGNGDFFAPEE